MKLLFLLFFSSEIAFAKITIMAAHAPVEAVSKEVSKKTSKKKISKAPTGAELKLLQKLKVQSEQILSLLEASVKQVERPLIWDGSKTIESTKVIPGILLNSVVSTNLESPLLIMALANDSIPEGSKFRCSGVTKNKRVLTLCDRMITPTKEVEVKVQVLNLDGSAGLRGEYNDGKDSYIAGAIISDFAKGVITASKSKLILPLGQVDESTERNKILAGLAGSASTTTDVLLDEMKSQEPKVFIEAGKPVLLFFMEGINAY
jgi:hypothetical protein